MAELLFIHFRKVYFLKNRLYCFRQGRCWVQSKHCQWHGGYPPMLKNPSSPSLIIQMPSLFLCLIFRPWLFIQLTIIRIANETEMARQWTISIKEQQPPRPLTLRKPFGGLLFATNGSRKLSETFSINKNIKLLHFVYLRSLIKIIIMGKR